MTDTTEERNGRLQVWELSAADYAELIDSGWTYKRRIVVSPIQYDNGNLIVVPDHCPECGESLYDSGCGAPGCTGRGCQDCRWGCDLDFVPEDESRCAQASAQETPEGHTARIGEERAFWGLPDRGDGN